MRDSEPLSAALPPRTAALPLVGPDAAPRAVTPARPLGRARKGTKAAMPRCEGARGEGRRGKACGGALQRSYSEPVCAGHASALPLDALGPITRGFGESWGCRSAGPTALVYLSHSATEATLGAGRGAHRAIESLGCVRPAPLQTHAADAT